MVQSAGSLGVSPEALLRIVPGHVHTSTRTGALLLQRSSSICGLGGDECRIEEIHAIALLATLAVAIAILACAFAFLREDREELITPLCPSLVVRDVDMHITLPKIPSMEMPNESMVVTDINGRPVCKVFVEWPDPYRMTTGGVALTVRLQTTLDVTLATVVARSYSVSGQGLALCRGGCEIFGFVEPDGKNQYAVRHRTSIPFLTLVGDFDNIDVEGVNPAGSKVCWFKMDGTGCKGRILQHVDAGLVICSLLATKVYQRLRAHPPPAWVTHSPAASLELPTGGGTTAAPAAPKFRGLAPDSDVPHEVVSPRSHGFEAAGSPDVPGMFPPASTVPGPRAALEAGGSSADGEGGVGEAALPFADEPTPAAAAPRAQSPDRAA